ncbi:MAG: hypothetical protein U0804_02615 [Gemmataceae bacterium]
MLRVFQARRAGETFAAIAARLGVADRSVAAVAIGRSHVHVLPDHPDRKACVRAERRRLTDREDGQRERASGKGRKRMQRAVWDYLIGYSIRTAAAWNGVGVSALHRELVGRGTARRAVGKRSPRKPPMPSP